MPFPVIRCRHRACVQKRRKPPGFDRLNKVPFKFSPTRGPELSAIFKPTRANTVDTPVNSYRYSTERFIPSRFCRKSIGRNGYSRGACAELVSLRTPCSAVCHRWNRTVHQLRISRGRLAVIRRAAGGNAVLAVLAGPNPETSLIAPLINLPDGKCCIQFAPVRGAAGAYTPSPQQ